MRQFRTSCIILNRTDYGEADRIITFLTPDHGKARAIAKGVRKSKSKLAGGIELFSVSDISFIPGKREISTVVSTRLIKHYGEIVKDLDRTAAAYECIRKMDKATEDAAEGQYYDLLKDTLEALDDSSIALELIVLWFDSQLLRLSGHRPNLTTDEVENKLVENKKYDFDFDAMRFKTGKSFDKDHIKFLRLLFSDNRPKAISKVEGCGSLASSATPLVQAMLQAHIRL